MYIAKAITILAPTYLPHLGTSGDGDGCTCDIYIHLHVTSFLDNICLVARFLCDTFLLPIANAMRK